MENQRFNSGPTEAELALREDDLRPQSRKSGRLLLTAVLLLAGLVVILSREVTALRGRLSQSQMRAAAMLPGAYAPQVTVASLNGDTVQLGMPGGRGAVYFVYNTRCHYCRESLTAWRNLHARYGASDSLLVVGISLDDPGLTDQFKREHSLPFTNVSIDERMRDLHRFGVVPQTVVLDPEGRVVLARVGVLNLGSSVDSVARIIDDLAAR